MMINVFLEEKIYYPTHSKWISSQWTTYQTSPSFNLCLGRSNFVDCYIENVYVLSM